MIFPLYSLKSNALTRIKIASGLFALAKCAATLCPPLHRFYPRAPDPSVTAITPEPHKHGRCTIDLSVFGLVHELTIVPRSVLLE
jgi:hypothetical protein